MTLDSARNAEVLAILDRYAEWYSNKDLEGFLSSCSGTISGFGSGPDEVVTGIPSLRAQLMRDFAQADSIRIAFDSIRVDGAMPAAWVTANCSFDVVSGGRKVCMKGRITLVLRNTGSRWLFEQVHFSMPNGSQAPGQSFQGN